jgi:multidrug transporter EmrE-like cation transporter
MLILFATTFFTAISQVLMKQSAQMEHKSWIYEYLNWRVILAYGIAFTVLMVNTYAYTEVDIKYASIIDSFSYVNVMVFSYLLLKEHFTKQQLIGNLVIIAGILIYTL